MQNEKKYEKGTLGYYRQLAKKDGFEEPDALVKWNKWRSENGRLPKINYNNNNIIYENLYGSYDEYNKKAIERGYKDLKEYVNKELPNSYRRGEDFWGDTIEKYVSSLFEDAIRMPCNYPFDWICRNGYKIQHKGSSIIYDDKGWSGFAYKINFNDVSDYFVLTGWKNRKDLIPLFVLLIHSEDIIRDKPFWDRKAFYLTNKSEYIKKFEQYNLYDKLQKLKDCCNRKI